MIYILFIISFYFIYYIYYHNKNNFDFSYIYKKCKRVIKKEKCTANDIIFNTYYYGYEFYDRLLNSSDCQICQTILYNSHAVQCKKKQKLIDHIYQRNINVTMNLIDYMELM